MQDTEISKTHKHCLASYEIRIGITQTTKKKSKEISRQKKNIDSIIELGNMGKLDIKNVVK